MTPLLFVGLFVAASAAPQFFHHPPPPPPPRDHPPFFHQRHLSPYFQDDIFNTENFWSGLSRELQQLDSMLAEFHSRFPTAVTREGIQGNEYKVTIPLSGFDEKDIVVKAREGLLMVQAVHKDEAGNENNYLNIRNLPTLVNVTGRWTYENAVLKIVFPVKAGSEHPVEETTDDTTTVAISTEGYKEQSREELESSREANTVNVDVGLERGDQEQDRHLLTNEIPRNSVEATTYAVDLKDEVEFVPVRY